MKIRVQIDVAILSCFLLFSPVLFQFPQLYPRNPLIDDVLDFFGLGFILTGTALRMVARGYKKLHSSQGSSLVTDGIYSLTRNPMYLGTFLVGLGFICIVWPWWGIPIYVFVFYTRFNKQMITEEAHLGKLFGKSYEKYIKDVPRIFPNFKNMTSEKLGKVFPKEETAWNTKERRGLYLWPVLAVGLEILQERFVFGNLDFAKTFFIFSLSIVLCISIYWLMFNSKIYGTNSKQI